MVEANYCLEANALSFEMVPMGPREGREREKKNSGTNQVACFNPASQHIASNSA